MTIDEGRYSRQIRFAPIGSAGQVRLAKARVLILGCGALGAACAEQLCRSGVGMLRLVDRDFVEASNLQRQSLYTDRDAAACLPKAVAAADHLRSINPSCSLESIVRDVRPAHIEGLLSGIDLAIDGSDNFPTRHLLNEACCKLGIPWVFGACVGAYGLSMPVLPGETPCLRCLQDQLPDAGDSPTCDTSGIIAPIVQVIAGWQVAEALKIIVGRLEACRLRRLRRSADLSAAPRTGLRWHRALRPRCGPGATCRSRGHGAPAGQARSGGGARQ